MRTKVASLILLSLIIILLSTHPSDEKRIRDIQAYLPQARKYAGK